MDKENLQQKDSFKIESISVNNKTYELQENNSCIVADGSIYCTTEPEPPIRAFGFWAGIILAIVLIFLLYLLCRNGR